MTKHHDPLALAYQLFSGATGRPFRRRMSLGCMALLFLCGVGVVQAAVDHPRLWLTPTSLTAMRARAVASNSGWITLRNACDSLAAMPVQFPDGTGPTGNVISGGYQYFDYLDPAITLGLGYQVAKTVDATRATNYAAKGRALLLALSDPVHHGRESTDSGWSIRAYGTALALGYDWLYDVLSPADRTQIYTEINRWTEWFDANGFGRDFPQGNYFAGYYCAKGLGALATEGDNPKAGAMWDDWLNRLHYGMVQPYYSQWLTGGGWPEGWNYGPNGTLNMLRPIVAAQTAKGLDLLHNASKPFAYPEAHALWMGHFTWPDLRSVDDRGLIYESDNPTATQAHWSTEYSGLLRLAGGTTAPQMQRYARDIRTITNQKAGAWAEFFHWDGSAAETDYKTARSYYTGKDGQVAMRSSWATDAVWGGFQSGPYTGYDGAGEQYYDEGSLTIKRGGVPFLVNAAGTFMRNTPGTDDANGWGDFIYNEIYGTQTDGVYAGRRIFNTFYAVRTGGYYGQFSYGPGETTTSLRHYEDGGSYVVMRGTNLEGMYMTGTPITAWSREVLFVRPNCFFVYDRTGVNSATANQWMAFHFLRTPVMQAGAAAGTTRYDVVDSTGAHAASPLFRGRVSTLLPAGHTVQLANVFNSDKVYRLEVRPPATKNNGWLTVFDAAASASQAAVARPLTVANGSVVSGAVEGSYLTYADGSGLCALFSTTGTVPGLPLSFKISTGANRLILPDLSLAAGYNVTASVNGIETTLTITSGTTFHASAEGVLSLLVSANGTASQDTGSVVAPSGAVITITVE